MQEFVKYEHTAIEGEIQTKNKVFLTHAVKACVGVETFLHFLTWSLDGLRGQCYVLADLLTVAVE